MISKGAYMETQKWLPRMTVATIIESDSRFLLVEEYSEEGELVYNQPAGHLERGEMLAEAAAREVLEETACEIQIDAIIGIYFWNNPNGYNFIRVCFSGKILQHHPIQQLDYGIKRMIWLGYEEITALGLSKLRSPMVLHCINDYISGKRYPLELFSYL
jgi:ADP-ribose pyrophosphatase YjhB (NUDIX family)